MKVQSQMMLSELFAAATAAGMSPAPVMPAWAELSLASQLASWRQVRTDRGATCRAS
jgi:hypothetical protein